VAISVDDEHVIEILHQESSYAVFAFRWEYRLSPKLVSTAVSMKLTAGEEEGKELFSRGLWISSRNDVI
jgi:hypothetical protein